MEEDNYFQRLNPDLIGKISSMLQPKDSANWKRTGKSMKKLIESTYNFDPNTVNVYPILQMFRFQYKSKDLEFDFVGYPDKGLNEYPNTNRFLNSLGKKNANLTIDLSNYSQTYLKYKNILICSDEEEYDKKINFNCSDASKKADITLNTKELIKYFKNIITLKYDYNKDQIEMCFSSFYPTRVPINIFEIKIPMKTYAWIPALDEVTNTVFVDDDED